MAAAIKNPDKFLLLSFSSPMTKEKFGIRTKMVYGLKLKIRIILTISIVKKGD